MARTENTTIPVTSHEGIKAGIMAKLARRVRRAEQDAAEWEQSYFSLLRDYRKIPAWFRWLFIRKAWRT